MCVHVYACVSVCAHPPVIAYEVEARRQLLGFGSLLVGSRELNLGCYAQWSVPLPAESPPCPDMLFS